MKPADAAALFTYLRSNFGNSAPPVDAATVAKALADAGESVHEVGVVEPAPGAEADCVVDHAESLWRS